MIVLGGGLEPPRLAAYAPQTYVSAISPPERWEARIEDGKWKMAARKSVFVSRSAIPLASGAAALRKN